MQLTKSFPVLLQSFESVFKEGAIVLAGDDALCRKRGLGIFGTGMHHDPLSSSKKLKIFHWGHDWVDLCIVAIPGGHRRKSLPCRSACDCIATARG